MTRSIPLAIALSLLHSVALAQDKILFIRGGTGTVGFLEGGADEQGADIDNYATNGGNHGWGELDAALVAEGFVTEQVAENPVNSLVPTPISLDTLDLNQYRVIVFGSNNAEYTTAQVDALVAFVAAGGAALFISDANFGQDWGDAPSSDQHFLDRFGLTMNQDSGTYTVDRAGEFLVPAHPIFNGVNTFDGEGVSPITTSSTVSGVVSTILSEVPNGQQVRRNNSNGKGSSSTETADDGTLVIATLGTGRIACHFDRNTFFNLNGAGTNINRFENEAYARNLFNWLAGKPNFNPATDNYAPRAHFPDLPVGTATPGGSPLDVTVEAKDPDGTVSYVDLFLDGQLVARDSAAPYDWTVPGQDLITGQRTLTATVVDNDGATTDVSLAINVLAAPIDRSGWILSSSVNNTGELGNAIDGSLSSRWPSRQFQTPGQMFGIDLGERLMFERILIETPNNSEDYPRGYIVRGSDNGVTFTDIISGPGDGPTTDILLPHPATFRHIQIEQTGSSTNRWWSIDEINVYQPAPEAVLPLDSWLQFYYGDTPDDLLFDRDKDGLTTLEEFAFNTNPLSAASLAGIIGTSDIDGSDQVRYLDITFRRWIDDNGVSYAIESTLALSTWSSAGLNPQQVGTPIPNGDGTETVTLRVKIPFRPGQGIRATSPSDHSLSDPANPALSVCDKHGGRQ